MTLTQGNAVVKNPPANARDIGDVVWSLDGEDPLKEEMEPTPVFLPGESHGQKSLVGYNPWSHKELDTTTQLSTNVFSHSFIQQMFTKLFIICRCKAKS